MGGSKKRVRPQRQMSLSNECWDTLTEIAEGSEDDESVQVEGHRITGAVLEGHQL